MKVGDVFTWENFPFQDDPTCPDKRRWFIHLGNTSTISFPVFLLCITSTTQLQHYDIGGGRRNHNFLRLKGGIGGFEEDCILDFSIGYIPELELSILDKYKSSITKRGEMPIERMREIWKYIIQEKNISRKEKLDMHFSWNNSGIEGLKKP